MRNKNLLGPWIRRFLLEHLAADRNMARNTQVSYRDTLVLLLPFLSKTQGKAVDRLTVEDVTPDALRAFLDHVEQERGCSTATRNVRLATIHSLATFVGMHSPEHVAWCSEIKNIPFKKTTKSTLRYLDKAEVDALLQAPDTATLLGMRDCALLLFLYNSGARASEAANLTIGDICWGSSPAVRLVGKGNRVRWCPIWPRTEVALKALAAQRPVQECVFLNRLNQPMTRFGIYSLILRAAERAGKEVPSLSIKRISPHCMRHACAVHLLRSGIDINTIRAWLGHVSLETTNIYAEVDLEMKAKALAHCDLPVDVPTKLWRKDPGLMEFLKRL